MSNPLWFYDTETCGLEGMLVTIQHALGDVEPYTVHSWREPVGTTLKLIEQMIDYNGGLCGFNLVFDHFHIQKCYNVFSLLSNKDKPPILAEVLDVEHEAVDGPCIKPQTALDLMLHSYQGPFQSLMERDDIVVRRVPRLLGRLLAEHLNQHLDIPGIYFKRREGRRWEVEELKPEPEDDLVNVRLVFAAAGGLKPLIAHLTGKNVADYPMPKYMYPKQPGWYPFHDPANSQSWGYKLNEQIIYWEHDKLAIKYALDDVVYTRQLWELFGRPEAGDKNSLLACAVASMRWHGFKTDKTKCEKARAAAWQQSLSAPTAPAEVLSSLRSKMTSIEALAVQDTSNKTLEAVQGWGDEHPAAQLAKAVSKARTAKLQVTLLDKLIKLDGLVHFAFKVIGTLSNRMSGDRDLNPHGINREGPIRYAMPLARDNQILSGGDFDSYEITIADAVYDDPGLHADLKAGKKIYGLFGEGLYDVSYDEVLKSKGAEQREEGVDMYDRSKHSVLGMLYGAMEERVAVTAGVPQEQGDKAVEVFYERYPGVKMARKSISDRFCSMRQPNGIGTNVEWHEPDEYVESLLGFRRYYTLENRLCHAIFELAKAPPKEWRKLKAKVIRQPHRGPQTMGGAVMSALYAAAFQIQARNMRTAANHEIQSTGADITKSLQLEIWGHQPCGIHEWIVQPLNAHDEIMVPHNTNISLIDTVQETIEKFRDVVPLLSMPWKERLPSWGDK